MFKVKSQLTNIRPSKSESPELSTTPTKGNIKLNAPGATKMGLTNGDYVSIVKAEDENGESLYAVKGNAGDDKNPQFGSILSSTSGKTGGSLQMSSENAFRELGGNSTTRKVYSIGEAIESEGKSYYKLNFVREETKAERKAK